MCVLFGFRAHRCIFLQEFRRSVEAKQDECTALRKLVDERKRLDARPDLEARLREAEIA